MPDDTVFSWRKALIKGPHLTASQAQKSDHRTHRPGLRRPIHASHLVGEKSHFLLKMRKKMHINSLILSIPDEMDEEIVFKKRLNGLRRFIKFNNMTRCSINMSASKASVKYLKVAGKRLSSPHTRFQLFVYNVTEESDFTIKEVIRFINKHKPSDIVLPSGMLIGNQWTQLVQALVNNNRLIVLGLSRQMINGRRLQILIDSGVLKSLTKLDLSFNGFDQEHIEMLLQYIKEHNPKLQVSLRGNRSGDALKSIIRMNEVREKQSLNLSEHMIIDQDMPFIIEACKTGAFSHINLYGNGITDVGCRALLTIFEDPTVSIDSIDLRMNPLTRDSIDAIAKTLAGNPHLKIIRIGTPALSFKLTDSDNVASLKRLFQILVDENTNLIDCLVAGYIGSKDLRVKVQAVLLRNQTIASIDEALKQLKTPIDHKSIEYILQNLKTLKQSPRPFLAMKAILSLLEECEKKYRNCDQPFEAINDIFQLLDSIRKEISQVLNEKSETEDPGRAAGIRPF